ncbi:hypothetical protein BTR23_11220 [Alkalihalophilus pseudofirmus]|nr:hypothetical protein BTR23_11220 [Alkalihalophilus pseudofirmus]
MQTINIESPIQAELIIQVANGKIINSNRTDIKIVKFTTTSLIFLSSLKFPVSEKVIYKVTLNMFGREMEVYGMILTSIKKDQTDDYYYEMNFKLSGYK